MRQAVFRDVLAVRELRALWVAELLSVVRDRLALVFLLTSGGAPFNAAYGRTTGIAGSVVRRVPHNEIAAAVGVPLALCFLQPPLAVVVPAWMISGACATAYLILARAAFARDASGHRRGVASGLAGAGVLSSLGVARFSRSTRPILSSRSQLEVLPAWCSPGS